MINLLVFVKQKTAYEVRISDWSSDVCSSDLVVAAPKRVARHRIFGVTVGIHRHGHAVDTLSDGRRDVLEMMVRRLIGGIEHGVQPADRKSVVEGKSVSGRVDLGGRRILNNINKHI